MRTVMLFCGLLLLAPSPTGAELYQWTDRDGVINVVDEAHEVPAAYRNQVKVYQSIKGAWGARGCTKVILEAATAKPLRRALVAAWRNTAPKRVVEQFEDDL